MEAVGHQERAVLCAQRLRRRQTDRQVTVAGATVAEGLQLHDQGRHQVERGPDARERLQHVHHAAIVLERVHTNPRQDVLARREVLVERLVHVPQQGESNHRVARAIMGSRR
jgi:hypothetical protein